MARRHDKAKVIRLAGFAVERGGYSLAKFYVASSDEQGHSKSISFFCPPSLVGAVRNLIDAGDYPEYESVSDFMRDALYHRFQYLSTTTLNRQLALSITETLAQVETENEMAKAEKIRANYLSLRRRITSWTDGMHSDKMPAWAISEFLVKMREHSESWIEPFRSMLIAHIDPLLSRYTSVSPDLA